MVSATNEAAFPSSLPWEEFTERRVTIDELRQRSEGTQVRLTLAHLADDRSPLLDRTKLADLLRTAAGSLDAEAQKLLERDLAAVGSWYLLPAARTVADADLDATRKYLAFLSKRGSPAFKALHHILSFFPAEIEKRIAADDSLACYGLRVDVLPVRDVLKDVERLLPHLTEVIGAKQAGRRALFVLNHSARLAAAAIKQTGLTLKPRRHTFKRPLPDVIGSGAEAFLGFFALLDSRVQPATLARALLSDRTGGANKNAAQTGPIKVGALSG